MSSAKFPPEELKQIVEEVASLLKERGETISVAETV
jgi:nicotinamide mononucleotide (NMN) deamidase PncC